ncbi:AfsR/SARP family transcriptional regulator [Streptomyces olivaceus]|uniref:AfsR/SARP family transcriptional regulator n=1 Tax=Streptomyces olivaceus TaxID=47716 RepID=UPI004055EF68
MPQSPVGGVRPVVPAFDESLRFAVLGPVRAWHGERELDLGSPQQRVVLAALLLRRGRLVTVGDLVDAVWGEKPPQAAVPVVRTYVSRLRKVLEPAREAGESPQVVVSVADGYLARVPGESLDLGVFEQRVTEARKLRAADAANAANSVDGVAAAADLLHAALGEWDGTPLAGLPGPLAETERSRLNEEQLKALEFRLDLDAQLGRHSEVTAELTSLTGEHPLRERLWQLLMLALYRSGRQAEALAAYHRARSTLVTELGIEPGPHLRELHGRILAADATLARVPSVKDPSPPPEEACPLLGDADPSADPAVCPGVKAARPAQLPADLPTFSGRCAALDQARALLPDEGDHPATVLISVICGMAGIGKTTLAVHWAHRIAHRFPDGQLYVNLRGFDPTGSVVSPGDAIRSFLDALGVPPQRIPTSLDARAALYRSLLTDRRVLILLDNARSTEQVRHLLPGSSGSLVIVTSRNQLTGLIANDGAHPLTLQPMTGPEAHSFLARRLGAGRLVAEPRAVDEIVARCAGLPLALAIVAARAAMNPGFTLSAVAEELRDSHGSLDAFAGGDLTTDVRAVFSWSCETLTAPAARLFHLLGLHSGPDISAPAAAALAGLPLREAHRLLAELTHAYLLTEHSPGRYVLHDLLRVYAAERVATEETPQEQERAVERLLCWYLHTADATYSFLAPQRRRVPLEPLPPNCRPLTFTTHDQALGWCETERVNLVNAVHQAALHRRPDITWRLSAVLWGFFYLRSHLHDWLYSTRTGLTASHGASDRRGVAWSLGDMAAALTQMRRFDKAIGHHRQTIALCRELGDTYGRAQALSSLGNTYLQAGRLDKAVEYTRRALAVDRALGNVWGEGVGLSGLGDAYQRLGRFEEAIECLKQALTVLRAIGDRWFGGVTLDILGTVHHRLHDAEAAIAYYHQALEAHRDVSNRWGEGHTLGHLGDVYQAVGAQEEARARWRQALEIFQEFGHPDAQEIRERLYSLDTGTFRFRISPADGVSAPAVVPNR